MSRQNAREAAVRFLYQCDMTGDAPCAAVESYFRNVQPDDEDLYIPLSDGDIEYMNSVLSGVSENIDEIDGIISANSKEWKINRISKTLMAIMRIAVFEMKFLEDVPAKVSINEPQPEEHASLRNMLSILPFLILKHFISWPPMSMIKSTSGWKKDAAR